MTSILVLLSFGLLMTSYANAGSCGIAGDPRSNMVLDVDELEDRDDIQMSFIGGKHVDAENEAEGKKNCLKACCDEEQCNIASFAAEGKSDKNCYLMKCGPLDKCLWKEEDGTTSMIVKRDAEDQSHVSVPSQSNETPPPATPVSPQVDSGPCTREGNLHKDQILDVDTLEDADDVNIMFLSATHVEGINEEEGVENCMKACCNQGQCNIATLMDFKAEKNCYMMKCSPLDKCIWKAESGRTSVVVKRDVTNQMPGNNDDKPAQVETEHVAPPTPEKPTNPPPSPVPGTEQQETKVVSEAPKAESANPTTPGKPQDVPGTPSAPPPVNVPQTTLGNPPASTQASTVPPAPTEKPTSVSTASPTAPPAPSEASRYPNTKAPATQPAATEAPQPTPAQTPIPATPPTEGPAFPKSDTPGGTAAPTEAVVATPAPTEKSPDTQAAGGPSASTQPSQDKPAPTEKPADSEDKHGDISATVLPVNPSASPVQPPQTDIPQSPITQEQVQEKPTTPSPQRVPSSTASQTTVKTEELTTLQPTSLRASTAVQQTPSPVINPQTKQARTTAADEGRRTSLLTTLKPTKSTISATDYSKSTSSPKVEHTQESVTHSTNIDDSEHLNSNSTSQVMGPEPIMPEAALPTLITILLFGALITGVVAFIVGRRCYESWQRRHYHKVDYLIEGLYN